MKNLLFLSTENPYPIDGGHHLRTYYILKYLSERYRIYFIGFAQDESEFQYTKNIMPYCQSVDMFRVAKTGFNPWFLRLALLNIFSRQPLIAQRYVVRHARKKIRNLISNHSIDLVHVDMLALGLYRKDLTAPAILTDHNVESIRLQRWMERETNRLKKTVLWLQWRKLLGFERSVCLSFDRCVAVSETDKNALIELCGKNHFDVIPNGVDTDYFKPAMQESLPNRLVWVGGMTGPYNADAVDFFLEQIWPQVATHHEKLSIDFVGSSPTRRLLQQAQTDKRIHIHGFVEDVRPFVDQAAVFIAPLRSGSGTKLKVLNAMAQGKAIVASPIAAEGIEAIPNRHLLIAEDATDFANAIKTLLHKPDFAKKLGQNARELIMAKYDWRVVAEILYNSYTAYYTSLKFKSVHSALQIEERG